MAQKTSFSIVLLLLISILGNAQSKFPEFPPDNVNHTMDRDQMLEQLDITFPELPSKLKDENIPKGNVPNDPNKPEGNWKDAKGNLVVRSSFGLWSNYDQSTPGIYTPIDLLKMKNGATISSPEEWWNERRPEIKYDVENEVWGVIPDKNKLPSVTFTSKISTGGKENFAYIQKDITGVIDVSRYPQVRDKPLIKAILRIPSNATEAVPVMIVFSGRKNSLNKYWEITAPNGWGVCIFSPNDLQPDNGTGLTSYLIGLVNKGNWRKPNDWGSLAAWSWGIGKLIDYFETDSQVNAKLIGLAGHSRYGKATLTAMAYEPRIVISYPSCGGALGPSMIRRHWGQDIENIAWDREYHWAAGNFLKFMGPLEGNNYLPRKVELLNVDAHSLLALCAPRPVFLNGGTQDSWSDPYGTYLTGESAGPVYELLGGKGVVMNDEWPVEDKEYLEGDVGYRNHIGGHTDTLDWPAFFKFASKYFNIPVLKE